MLKSFWIGLIVCFCGMAFATVEIYWTLGGGIVDDGSTRGDPILAPAGALGQLIWAGADNLRNPPDLSNPPHFLSGDDVLLASTNYTSAGGFGQPGIPGEYSLTGSTPDSPTFAYARVFASSNPTVGDCRYANTPLIELSEQTASDARPADVVDMTASPTFTTTVELNSIPVLVTRLHCSDMGGCIAIDIDRGTDADGEFATAVPVGTGPFSYAWSPSAGSQTNATAFALAVGGHSVVVTDLGQADCVVTSTFSVFPSLSFLLEVIPATCESGTGGAFVSQVAGLGDAFFYRWRNLPAGASVQGGSVSGLPVGNYQVEVYNDRGDSSIQQFEIVSTFGDLDFDITVLPADCGDIGSGALGVTNLRGGSGAYEISWEGENGNFSGTGISGLLPGPYRITVADATSNGCKVVRDVVLPGGGPGPVINCASQTVFHICPDEGIDLQDIGLRLATDENGNVLVPHGEPQARVDGCDTFATYQFSLTNDCSITRCTAHVTIRPPLPSLATRPASFEDRQLACDSGLPVPDLLALDSLFESCLDFEVEVEQLSPNLGCLGPDSSAGYIFTAFTTCGQSRSFTQLFSWASDTTAPVVQPPPLLIIEECGTLPEPDPNRIVASDDCSTFLLRDVLRETTVILPDGMNELVRTWLIADPCVNTTTVDEVIHFMDLAIAPRFINLPQTHIHIDTNLTVPDYINNPPADFLPIIPPGDVTVLDITQDPPAGTVLERPSSITILFTIENRCGRLQTNGLTSVIQERRVVHGGSGVAGSGGDVVSGIITTNYALVLEDDASPVSVPLLRMEPDLQGAVWLDYNANGRLDNHPLERMMDGIVVYLDVNDNGSRDGFEPAVQTDADGEYAFYNLNLGAHNLAIEAPLGYAVTTNGATRQVQVVDGQTARETFALQGTMQADALVWYDVNMDGTPLAENISALAIPGVELILFYQGATELVEIARQPSDAGGLTSFKNLLPDTSYIVAMEVDPSTPPLSTPNVYNLLIQPESDGSTPAGYLAPQGGANISQDGIFLAFGFAATATAIRLEDMQAVGDTIRWTTGWEQDTLGFFVMRQIGDGDATQVNDTLIIATGGGSGARYQLVDPNPPAAGVDAQYFIREIETDLDVEDYDSVSLVHAATPVGEPITLIASAAPGDVITTEGAGSLLISGVDAETPLLDITDPARPIPLQGERLETDAATGVYFSWPAGRRIQLP